ncbi:hypothetical protein ACIBUY_03730 [Streptomyces sp. NPDC050085]
MDTLHLLNVRYDMLPDTGAWHMSWEPVAQIPLGGAAAGEAGRGR